MQRRHGTAAAAMVLLAAGLGVTGDGPAAGSAAPPGQARAGGSAWQKVSTGTIGITYRSSLYRTADGVLHVVYPKLGGGEKVQLGHTAIDADGSIALQNNILPTDWATIDTSPIVIGDADGGIRVVAAGKESETGFWSQGRMYTMTAPASGTPWTLPMQAVGQSTEAYGSAGTAATALADGTPVAAFPLNSDITWHTGTAETPDETFAADECCVSDMSMVRDGDDVWISWYGNGGTAATSGTFVRRIAPTLGPILKAPQSSQGASSAPTGRTALVARDGGGVFAAYCVGYPNCDYIGLWKVGGDKVVKVPGTRYAALISLSPGPSGRMWIAWSDNIPNVHAVRSNIAGTKVGPGRLIGLPPGATAVHALAINGTTSRGDIVVNVGNAFWHTQVAPGLSVSAKPGSWKHGKTTKVTFTVTDAGDKVPGATVKVGSKKCKTAASGRCAITFSKKTKAGQLVAKASKSGYGAGSTRLKVR